MMTTDEAVTIARSAVEGKCELQKDAPVHVTLSDDQYDVIFVHVNPNGVRGADYDARVRIDAHTGEVLEILGGP